MPERDTYNLWSAEPGGISDLRWLVTLRWFAGAAIVIGAALHGLLTTVTVQHGAAVALGGFVLVYNALFERLGQRIHGTPDTIATAPAALQIALDLGVLTLLTIWTGGLSSPLLGLFVLHMVLGSLLLAPLMAYGVAGCAIVMMLCALWAAGSLPLPSGAGSIQLLSAATWSATLFLTVFLTSRIVARLRWDETALRQQHNRTSAILDTAVDAIVTIDQRGIVASANRASKRIFGYEPTELVGQNISLVMPEPHRSEHDGYLERYMQTGEARIIGIGREVTVLRKDGTLVPVELSVSEVSLESTRDARLFTGIVRDISERKAAETELRALNESLRKHQKALIQQEKMAAMGQMAAGVAHEISNPLANMDSLLHLMDRQPSRVSSANIRSLREQVARITRIVKELTAFAHPKSAGWSQACLDEIVRGSLEMVRFDHRIRNVAVSCDCEQCEPARVMPQGLQQVLVNLILNALDAMKDCADPKLSIRSYTEDEWHIIEVEDTGHGVAPEHLPRIFEPFFTTKPVGQGTGLGLSISGSIVERHGGRLEVASTPGEGTRFRILLPRTHPSAFKDASYSRETIASTVPENGKCPR